MPRLQGDVRTKGKKYSKLLAGSLRRAESLSQHLSPSPSDPRAGQGSGHGEFFPLAAS